MRRLFWLGLGIAAGVLVVRTVTRKAQALSPSGLAGSAQVSASRALDSVRTFVEDVRQNMAARELEIQEAMAEGVTLASDERYLADGRYAQDEN